MSAHYYLSPEIQYLLDFHQSIFRYIFFKKTFLILFYILQKGGSHRIWLHLYFQIPLLNGLIWAWLPLMTTARNVLLFPNAIASKQVSWPSVALAYEQVASSELILQSLNCLQPAASERAFFHTNFSESWNLHCFMAHLLRRLPCMMLSLIQ